MKSQDTTAERIMEMAVAKFLRILSANLMTTAMMSPPQPCTRAHGRRHRKAVQNLREVVLIKGEYLHGDVEEGKLGVAEEEGPGVFHAPNLGGGAEERELEREERELDACTALKPLAD